MTLLSCNFGINKEPIISVGMFSYQFKDFVREKSFENISSPDDVASIYIKM